MRYDLRLQEKTSTERILEIAQWCESRELATLWCSEAGHDPFAALMVAAMGTRELPLGTGIAVAFARSPFSMAQLCWDIQRLSDGRLRLGLGTQIKAHVERRYGMGWQGAREPLREYVALCRHLWRCWQERQRPSFQGQFYRCDLSNPEFEPPPLQEEHAHIPVWLAAVGPGMASLAGEVADGLHVHAFHTEGYLRDRILPAIAEGQRRAGRGSWQLPATCPVMGGVAHDEHEAEQLRAAFRRHVAFYASTPSYLPVLEHGGWAEVHEPLRALSRERRWSEMAALIDDAMLDEFALVDEPGRLGERLSQRYEGVLTQLALYREGERFMSLADWGELFDGLRYRVYSKGGQAEWARS